MTEISPEELDALEQAQDENEQLLETIRQYDSVIQAVATELGYEAQITSLRNQLAEKEAALAGCVEVLTNVNDALERNRIICTDWTGPEPKSYITDFLAALPQSAKQDAEILRVANDLAAADSKESAVWDSEPFNADAFSTASRDTQDAFLVLCQAVRAREGK